MVNLIVNRRPPRCTLKAAAERYRADNIAAAKIILADPKYEGLMREIALMTLANAQADAENRSRNGDVRLADEPGGQLDLFDQAVERSAA